MNNRMTALEDMIATQNDRISKQDDKISKLDEKISKLDEKISSLEGQVRRLNDKDIDYHHIRNRFLETFKCDILGRTKTPASQATINKGNQAAHEGDCITDATLYYNNIRQDDGLLRDIYGLFPRQILNQRKLFNCMLI
jgi:uncharacterized coiled-coil protein SlyX